MSTRIEPTHPVTRRSYWEDAYHPGWGRVVKVLDVTPTHVTFIVLMNTRCLQSSIDNRVLVGGGGNALMDMRGRIATVTRDRFRPISNGFLRVAGRQEMRRRERVREQDRREFMAILNRPHVARDWQYDHERTEELIRDWSTSRPEHYTADGDPVQFARIPKGETFRL